MKYIFWFIGRKFIFFILFENLSFRGCRLGIDFHLNRIITLSSGISTGGNQGDNINIPAGITYNAPRRHYELGFATQDLSSFIGDIEGGGNNISFAIASLRFKF